MITIARIAFSVVATLGFGTVVLAQMPPVGGNPMPKQPMVAPATNAVAARVNNQPIPEVAVRRALNAVPTEERAKARTDVINYLVENTLIDQYLAALKIPVEPKEIDAQLETFKADLKKHEQDYANVLKKMELTEADLKEQIFNQLRWEHFVNKQATEKALRDLFTSTPEGFDNTTVRARHILLPIGTTPEEKKAAAERMAAIKQLIEKTVADGMAKLPADTDTINKEKKRQALMDETFSAAAKKYSTCPSKNSGGDLMWFPRIGSMVEPFAKAAFAMQPYQLSEVVTTQFGYHLILVTARKPGVAVKFEDVKEEVKEVYGNKLREAVLAHMKPKAKIEITPVKE